MTAHTKLTVLDRLHTLVTVGLGSAAVLAVGLNLPKPTSTLWQFAWVAVGLGAGYGTAYLADTGYSQLFRARRQRLLNSVRDLQKTTCWFCGSDDNPVNASVCGFCNHHFADAPTQAPA